MTTLSEENRELRMKIASLEQALGRASYELFEKLANVGRFGAAKCPDAVVALTLADPAEGIEWYAEVLGAREVFRVHDAEGRVAHAALRLGDAVITINSEYPEQGKVGPSKLGAKKGEHSVAITVFVQDSKATFAKAVKSGGHGITPPKEQFWGDVTGTLADPFGHHWAIATNVEPLSAGEITRRAKQEFKQG